ncbi:hypothetical protein [Desulfospira joergensenii]|uniref:hypothetical protein n=1 Tax=Desulfospira joergensenii TaxID=53329 RepID=UPI0003B536C2|nr:hypothetical protein [Desulfospira joergensenii]
MKILSSAINYASSSQLSHSSENTLYSLDQNGQVVHKDRHTGKENRQTQSSAYFYTGGQDTVDIGDEARTASARTTRESEEASGDDDLEKNLYAASVFEWAANAIDWLVNAFESRDVTRQTRMSTQILEPSLLQTPSGHITDKRFSIYTSMASELRAKAAALRPEQMSASDNRINRFTLHEKEKTQVQASGIIQTADGRKIDFSLDVLMERETTSAITETFRIVDPLVINYSGTSAELSDEKMAFDLDGDGQEEQIARLKQGSGFLALDLNRDGKINNGKELFGPSTGNGFQELSFYDKDNNHWIDENDAVYEDLMVWIQEDSGENVLKKLSETGIGAIHLGSVSSEFQLKSSNGTSLGQITSTGVALTEEGQVKTVQQLDLTV